MTKAINDATKQKMGDIFQYLVALRDCFQLKDGETLQIEVNGDVSVLTGNGNRFQKEVKHHLCEETLSDRNIDFWKTLANWYTDYDRIKSFKELILYTTASIKQSSSFSNWNTLKKEVKLSQIKQIGTVSKAKEKVFREQYIRIFNTNYNEDKLLDILEKFTIEASRKDIVGISDEFSQYIGHIPKANRDQFIGALLGQIMYLVRDYPHKWELTRSDFESFLQKESAAYGISANKPLPNAYALQTIPEAVGNQLKDKPFVEAIIDIDYREVVPDAISDYWKMCMTVATFLQNDLSYISSIQLYKENLSKRLTISKRQTSRKIQPGCNTQETRIVASKDLYDQVMLWDAADFGSIVKNQDFFQHGVIHDIVENREFEWKIGEKNEH